MDGLLGRHPRPRPTRCLLSRGLQGDSSTVPGLEDVLVGARPGSKFRALVPPELGYQAAPGALPQVNLLAQCPWRGVGPAA